MKTTKVFRCKRFALYGTVYWLTALLEVLVVMCNYAVTMLTVQLWHFDKVFAPLGVDLVQCL